MPHVILESSAGPETVMIEDESGVEQPWAVIPRPEVIKKNCNLRKLMDLGSDSDDEDNETNVAQKAIYRSICKGIRHSTNALIPGAMLGKLKWKQITSGEKSAVHNEVMELNPYLRRFPGGWLTEVVMQRQLRNARDTASRSNDSEEEQAKPLTLLSKMSRVTKVKDKSRAAHKRHTAPATSASAIRGSKQAKESTKSGTRKRRASNDNTDSDHRDHTTDNHSEPDTDQEVIDAVSSSNPKKKAKKSSGKTRPSTGTGHQKGPRASATSHNDEPIPSTDSGSDSEDWEDDVNHQIANLKPKKSTKEAPAAGGSRPKPRPKHPRKGGKDRDETDFFRLDTRAEKQELIDEDGAIAEGSSKTKSIPKGKKRKSTTKK